MSKNLRKLEKFYLNISDNYRHLVLALLLILIPGVYLLVYHTGGAKFVYTHTMYFPIVLASLSLGNPWGALTGLVGGILLGPMMPLDTQTYQSQQTINWIFRTVIFILIGLLSGFLLRLFATFLTNFPNIYPPIPKPILTIPTISRITRFPINRIKII